MEIQLDKTIGELIHEEMGENIESAFIGVIRKDKSPHSLAARIPSRHLELRNEEIRESMIGFIGIEHRLEFVMKIRGITFINDSKATSVNAVWYALETCSGEIVLIMGGVDKSNDYDGIKELIRKKVKAIVCLTKDPSKINAAFADVVEVIVNTFSMSEAVEMTYHLAKRGDTVILSPACASFDLFKNYEDRGTQFKDHVKEL